MNLRLIKIRAELKKNKLDGLLVSLPANISYLTESISRDAYLLICAEKNIYFTDSRYTEEAKGFLKDNACLEQSNGSVFKAIAKACRKLGLKNVGFEERYLAFAEFARLHQLSKNEFSLVPTHGLVEQLREIKDASEIAKIRKAVQITQATVEHISKFLHPGLKEVEVVGEIERFIRLTGARACAFDVIVASGPNSSKPHHLSGERLICDNQPVLIDLGVEYQGYKSDLTRVFFLGKINVLLRKVYNIVLKAQEKAIKLIRPNVEIAEIDKAARDYIAKCGYAGKFEHNLGHGFGLEVHESPHISAKEGSLVEAGMIFTIEPGIYLPGKFGVRIEDMILVTNKGCEVLSGAVHK
ncbi:MAG: Xaa-Pro peptidase family protein [Candidatus Omnitrophica bacterium]|jgi:Xaa-Pro aminopeptidase|nr:Xaa-Pro peptidase family protein [Candidatus Omnitrophota bacterium]